MPTIPQHEKTESAGIVYAGASGWAYASWKPGFYPPDVPAKRFLEHYAARLNSVEVNYTFRRMPSLATVANWLAQTGSDFRFSFKAPQQITHMRRLKDCGQILESLSVALKPVADAGKMGVILFQLPPNFKADLPRLREFLKDAGQIAEMPRIAFEFRHESWFTDEAYEVLRRHGEVGAGAALCVAESDELETPDVTTAAFSCYRLRKSSYSEGAVQAIAGRIRKRAARGDVFAYFKHEETPEGALHAEYLIKQLGRK